MRRNSTQQRVAWTVRSAEEGGARAPASALQPLMRPGDGKGGAVHLPASKQHTSGFRARA
eukprot:1402467-Alexandrium_andersonii.AAC.1